MSLEKEREGKALSPTGIMDALENFKEPFPSAFFVVHLEILRIAL